MIRLSPNYGLNSAAPLRVLFLRLFCIAGGKEQDSFVVRHPR
nr:MAG TPA: hypothetical protein [Caudoviricetes sp.]